jgi:hypothetical protein
MSREINELKRLNDKEIVDGRFECVLRNIRVTFFSRMCDSAVGTARARHLFEKLMD